MDPLEKTKSQIARDIKENRVMLYMKGNKMMPQCGFSAQVVQILNKIGVEFQTKDVLQDAELRQAIKEFSNWPTIPQLYINGEFIGGCDVATELYQSGELQKLLGKN
jgi:monothiol glutaredoxin